MFNRDAGTPRIDTLIASSVRVHGGLTFAGGLHLEGQIAGDVIANPSEGASLSVAESASIEGRVDVPSITLNGTIVGDIVARTRIVLGASARVRGNLSYGVIEMSRGAQIMGKLTRLDPSSDGLV